MSAAPAGSGTPVAAPGHGSPARRPRARRLATLVVAVGLGLSLAGSAVAAPAPAVATAAPATPMDNGLEKKARSLKSKIDKTRDSLHESSSALAAAYTALETTRAQLPGAEAALANAQSVAAVAEQDYAQAVQDLQVAQANEEKAQAQLEDTTKDIADGRLKVARLASQLYTDQGFGELGIALGSQSPEELATRLAMADTVLDVQDATLGRLAEAKAAQDSAQAHLSALREVRAQAKARSESALARAKVARDAAAAAKQRLDNLEVAQARRARGLAAKVADERRTLKSMQAENAALTKKLRDLARREAKKHKNKGNGAGAGTGGPGYLSSPLPAGFSPGSPFGLRFHPILHYWRMHEGNDWGAPCGTPLYATAGGTVIEARYSAFGYGNRVHINHGWVRGVNLVTSTNHMQSISVHNGQHVRRGQVIGYVGTTGLSTECHLHFETRENGVAVNPEKWL